MLSNFLIQSILGSLVFGFFLSLFSINVKFRECINEWFKKDLKNDSTYYMIFLIIGFICGIVDFIISL